MELPQCKVSRCVQGREEYLVCTVLVGQVFEQPRCVLHCACLCGISWVEGSQLCYLVDVRPCAGLMLQPSAATRDWGAIGD